MLATLARWSGAGGSAEPAKPVAESGAKAGGVECAIRDSVDIATLHRAVRRLGSATAALEADAEALVATSWVAAARQLAADTVRRVALRVAGDGGQQAGAVRVRTSDQPLPTGTEPPPPSPCGEGEDVLHGSFVAYRQSGGDVGAHGEINMRGCPSFAALCSLMGLAVRRLGPPGETVAALREQLPNMTTYIDSIIHLGEGTHSLTLPSGERITIPKLAMCKPAPPPFQGEFDEIELRLSIDPAKAAAAFGPEAAQQLARSVDTVVCISDGDESPIPPSPGDRIKLARVLWHAALQFVEINAWRRRSDGALVWMRRNAATGKNEPIRDPQGEWRVWDAEAACRAGAHLLLEAWVPAQVGGMQVPPVRLMAAMGTESADPATPGGPPRVRRSVTIRLHDVCDTWSHTLAGWLVDVGAVVRRLQHTFELRFSLEEPAGDASAAEGACLRLSARLAAPEWAARLAGNSQGAARATHADPEGPPTPQASADSPGTPGPAPLGLLNDCSHVLRIGGRFLSALAEDLGKMLDGAQGTGEGERDDTSGEEVD
eukprot:TRINITY_DN55599_c0_g1_i1.p1 TRINITY_DN55599_c0_g1~~TRINITY_DN55599_c0_g1_i1.p1  ORF type:complete len:578 (+),score=173.01 TRINITY_DN55599_c0_g1_i1:102-1736(+)